MKILISYFYKIRFMKPYMVPLSTCCFDPKWFHKSNGHKYIYKDKNGVYNGLRAEPFVPGEECEGLCRGPENCDTGNSNTCAFLANYRKQLDKLDFNNIMQRFERIGNLIKEKESFKEEPICVLIVYETPSNPCSERRVIKQWFKEHGVEVEEFDSI